MAVDAAEEVVGIDGVVAFGEYGVAVAPTDGDSPLGVTWRDAGLVTSDGVTRSEQATSTRRSAWQNNTKLRTLITESGVRFKLTLVQTNEDTVELFHGVAVDADGSLITNPGVERPRIAFCLDVIDRDAAGVESVVREYAPNAQVIEVGDQVAVAGDTFGWPVTVEASYDETLGGYTQRWFTALAGS
jgi:hypothetical protein